jgi:hypothetical protein
MPEELIKQYNDKKLSDTVTNKLSLTLPQQIKNESKAQYNEREPV